MTSPLPVKEERILELSFYDALRECVEKKKVTRLEWNSKDIYCFLDDFLYINNETGTHRLIVSRNDIEAIDWVVLK